LLPIDRILDMIAENTLQNGCPVPAPRDVAYSWARGLKLPRDGEYMLYTGCLYQLAPYIKKLSARLEELEGHKLAGSLLSAAKMLGRVASLSSLIGKPPREEVERSSRILRSIVGLLERSGVNLGYLYEDDLYSGILLYDLGLDEAFAKHASKVYKVLSSKHRKIVTVDPHTHVALTRIYPKFIDSYSLEVYNYIELLDKSIIGKIEAKGSPVIHDSCLYARVAEMHGRIRDLLRETGISYKEPKHSGKNTMCCGGPVESIAPRLAHSIARKRLAELLDESREVLVMCPLCYVNLSIVAGGRASFKDLAELLWEAVSREKP